MAKSGLSVRFSVFQWKVENALSSNTLLSDEFVLGECRWRLQLSQSAGDITISLSKLNPEKLNWRYKIQAYIEDRNEKDLATGEHDLENPNFTTRNIWWIHRDVLRAQRDAYLTDGTLTFVVVFMPTNIFEKDVVGEKEVSTQTAEDPDPLLSFEHLSHDFQHLLDDGLLSDVTLKCGDRTIPAHRNILSARSDVFLAMLRNDMSESRTGVIEVSDMQPSTLDQLVQYIYSGRVSTLSADSAQQLYAAADKYAIDSLKRLCGNFMKDNLNELNAFSFLALADAHGDKDLKDCVLSFATNTDLLQNKKNWLKLHKKHPKLAAEVTYHAYMEKCLPK